eukprot:403360844
MIPQFLFFSIIGVVLIIAIIDYKKILVLFHELIQWVQEDPLQAGVVIVLIYIGLVILSLPLAIISIPLGYAFCKAFSNWFVGFSFGFVVLSFGILIGGALAFLISRYLLKDTFKRGFLKRMKTFNALDRAITQEVYFTLRHLLNFIILLNNLLTKIVFQGAWLIFLMRLTVLPYSLTSYLLGLTHVKFSQFALGNFGEMYHIILWLYLGSTLTHLDIFDDPTSSTSNQDSAISAETQQENKSHQMIVVGEIVIAVLIGIYVSFVAKREFDKRIDEDNQIINGENCGVNELSPLSKFAGGPKRQQDQEEGTPLMLTEFESPHDKYNVDDDEINQ